MSRNITLAYAVPVDPAMAAASLLTYSSTKAALTTFRLCVRSAQNQSLPLGRLPLEIRLAIEDIVFVSTRVRECDYWDSRFDCLADRCSPQSHLTAAEDKELRERAMEECDVIFPEDSNNEWPEEFEDFFSDFLSFHDDQWRETHEEMMDDLHTQVTKPTSKLAKSRALLAKDVGLNVHFDVVPEYMEESYSYLMSAQVTAFLTLPRYKCAMRGIRGPNEGIFSLAVKIDPRLFRPLKKDEKACFHRTLRMLKLKAKTNHSRESDSEGRKWPALMLLGSGSLEAFPDV